MYSAIADEPTNPMARMRGSVSSASTASLSPLTTLSTPAGSPASTSSSASRIGEGLAVLGGEQLGEAVELLLHQLEKLEHHARAPLRVGRGPGRLRRIGV